MAGKTCEKAKSKELIVDTRTKHEFSGELRHRPTFLSRKIEGVV